MKIALLLVLSLGLSAPIAAANKQPFFRIYLVRGAVDARVLAKDPEGWKSIPLESEPIISDTDIVAYDFSTHAMKLKREALKRLPRPSVAGIPFVIVVDGQRIYPGAFYTAFSSIPCGMPVIVTDRNGTNSRSMSDVIFIERAYPDSPAQGRDPRSDQRVRTVFESLNKLAVP